ncbi:MAG TPA: hypothetical protein VIO81_12865 [Methyloversatilis sp.]
MHRTGALLRAVPAVLCLCAGVATVRAAEPLSPLANPSLYEQRGIVGNIDTATGSMNIGGKRYRANARTVIFITDAQGRIRKGNTIADIPANATVSFAAGADGTLTQVYVGGGILPLRP